MFHKKKSDAKKKYIGIKYIKANQENLKICLFYEQLPFIFRLKLYALFIKGKNKAALNKQ